jgi:hypothetical protein
VRTYALLNPCILIFITVRCLSKNGRSISSPGPQLDRVLVTHVLLPPPILRLCECCSEVLCAIVLVKSGLENRDYGRRGSAALTMRHTSIRKGWQ